MVKRLPTLEKKVLGVDHIAITKDGSASAAKADKPILG